jgi:alkanesulfonate monooxygenase SsuD/methylene tetrahydromethanopterin reductase-like flavin-dependent oxidoreductase (luciferase family)
LPDYGHQIEFGYFLVPDARHPDEVLETAALADRLGYDLAAATLDVLSGGRFEAGLGGGGFLEPAHAMGAPALTPGESLEALEEAVTILRESWSGVPGLRFQGRHYQLDGMRPGPQPAHEIPIWLGAAKPRALAHLALDLGFGTFVLMTPPDPNTVRTFIEEVAPRVRERVAAARDAKRPG